MKRNLVFIPFCFIMMIANAFSISGNVKTDSMKALPFASVYVKEAQIGATTDLDGNYTIKGIPAGSHTLIVSFIGYETQVIELSLESDGIHNFVMHEQAITLNDIFVTPTGESIERFILSQTVKNRKRLSERMKSFSCTEVVNYEQRNNNMKVLIEPHLKTVNAFLGILGLRNFFHTLMNHPNLKVEMTSNIQFNKGKWVFNEPKMNYSNPVLKDEEVKSWIKILSKRSNVSYDVLYDKLADIKKGLEKMDKKSSGESASHLTYRGSYKEKKKTIHIIQYDKLQFHIVDGCWQIRRALQLKGQNGASKIAEFQELVKNVFMPVSLYSENTFGLKKVVQEELDRLNKADTSSMNQKKQMKHDTRVKSLENAIKDNADTFILSFTYNYKDFASIP